MNRLWAPRLRLVALLKDWIMSIESFRHEDGRVCRFLPYALDGQVGLLHAWFYGVPPEMRRCQREHGLEDSEGTTSDDSA